MQLRTTEDYDTHPYATSPLNFGGVEKEDLFWWLIPMTIGHHVFDDPIYSFMLGTVCLWFYKQLTRNTPPGHMVLRASIWMGEWHNSKLADEYPPLKSVLRFLNRMMTGVWLELGLPPSPTYCKLYEP